MLCSLAVIAVQWHANANKLACYVVRIYVPQSLRDSSV